jgi:pantoate--beta-alanine ligase
MAADLDLGVEIVEMPIVREADGLAMSSRNVYLSPEERQRALCISRAICGAEELLRSGARVPAVLKDLVRESLDEVDRIDYIELVDSNTMKPVTGVSGPVTLAVAAYVGNTRLLDNLKYVP